jgi:hypothetical protein
MSKLDEKLKASVKPTRGKTVTPAKASAARPTAKTAAKRNAGKKPSAPARETSAIDSVNSSSLFPERVWPD